ncbi:TPA: hypothetical protein ACX3DU_004565 [Vibrio parahaemolyticus]
MNSKLDLSLVVYGLTLFSGVSYLWGFWLNFEVNILSYIALTDVIKASVYPALPALAILAFYSAMDGFNSMSKGEHDMYVAEGGVSRGYAYFLKVYCALCFLLGLGNAIFLIVVNEGYFRLLGIYPLVSICLFLYLVFSNKFLLSIPVKSRVFVISVICFLPTYLFNKGYTNGSLVSDHNAVGQYVVADGYCSSSEGNKFRFISVMGDKLFATSSKDESICVRKAEDFLLVKYNVPTKANKSHQTTDASNENTANKLLKSDS